VIKLKDKYEIIKLKVQGLSDREVAKQLGLNRRTVSKYWIEHSAQVAMLKGDDVREAQEQIFAEPRYDASGRKSVKYTPEINAAIDEILTSEAEKNKVLGSSNKQKLTCVQIHEALLGQGFDIGLTTVTAHVKEKRRKAQEAFIRQTYNLGDRLEYDFGEVKLVIAGMVITCYLAAVCATASKFRWAWLYPNQTKESFTDSHVRLFEMVGGVWRECVYDNMKNVVSRFIGKNEKELNQDLVKMSLYYGFEINVTNCFSPEEKGSVESAVKLIRNKAFATRYEFDSFEDAQAYLQDKLVDINVGSSIEEEKSALLAYKQPLEIANIVEAAVDKYSFIRVANNFYSVPEYLVGKRLTVKLYPAEIIIYAGQKMVAKHKRLMGYLGYSVDIYHYLDTLTKKPGAVKNSVALQSQAKLKAIFDEHFSKRPKDFVLLLKEHDGYPIDEVVRRISDAATSNIISITHPADTIAENVRLNTRQQLSALSGATLKGGERVAG
jgi:transposase